MRSTALTVSAFCIEEDSIKNGLELYFVIQLCVIIRILICTAD